jgi:hypothetical protein
MVEGIGVYIYKTWKRGRGRWNIKPSLDIITKNWGSREGDWVLIRRDDAEALGIQITEGVTAVEEHTSTWLDRRFDPESARAMEERL